MKTEQLLAVVYDPAQANETQSMLEMVLKWIDEWIEGRGNKLLVILWSYLRRFISPAAVADHVKTTQPLLNLETAEVNDWSGLIDFALSLIDNYVEAKGGVFFKLAWKFFRDQFKPGLVVAQLKMK